MNLKAGLLGGGSWGTTVAALVARNAPITIWARNSETVDEINNEHTNKNTQLTLNYCLTHPQWKLSLQTHKMLGIA